MTPDNNYANTSGPPRAHSRHRRRLPRPGDRSYPMSPGMAPLLPHTLFPLVAGSPTLLLLLTVSLLQSEDYRY
jgi:hypothetical protein